MNVPVAVGVIEGKQSDVGLSAADTGPTELDEGLQASDLPLLRQRRVVRLSIDAGLAGLADRLASALGLDLVVEALFGLVCAALGACLGVHRKDLTGYSDPCQPAQVHTLLR